ncbi:Uncharacterized protein LSUB1_G001218 [Lachnellula subtilissima]|uniref:Oxidoreductase n=1 Tax=Lachnellula subtilissima TaxID=602034 RepID=A0A8H8UC98_9HELO|nr:Uncharacterized protein LSUB1_G001218 [Lachnellula subtilissima]
MQFAVALNSATACGEFLESEDPSIIACQLRADEEACRSGRLPSLLALYVQSLSPKKADLVATQLCPETAKYSRSIKMVQYSGIVGSIKAYLTHMTHENRLENLPGVRPEKAKYYPSTEEQVSDHASTPLEDIVNALEESLKASSSGYQDDLPQVPIRESMPITKSQRKCYICQFWLVTPHPQYQSLCKACGDFNLASSNLSLPSNLQLVSKTALVTGARIHLGFHTALRLLRSGAKVIISSRYPLNAASRYLAEPDSENWGDSLKIIGADFRAARDVFQLVECVKEILKEWDIGGVGKLDILVNNAAQTWTDSIQKEQEAIEQEEMLYLERSASHCSILVASDYVPRVRGGTQESEPLITLSQLREQIVEAIHNTPDGDNVVANLSINGNTSMAVQDPSDKCSQHICPTNPHPGATPPHGHNTFPTSPPSIHQTPRSHHHVSAREGMFEANPKSKHKNGQHVHTNLTKAALNMLTETEAWPAWRERRVAMNSVDPGYLSMPLEMEKRGKKCPIGWEDGAGRVLWPVAVGERGEAVWGRFLKDYGAYYVDVGVGR